MSEDIKNMSDDQEPESYDVLLRNGVKPNDFYSNGKSKMDCPNFKLELLQSEYIRIRRYLYGLTAVVVTGILILIVVVAVLFGKLSHDLVNHEHKPKVGEQISAMQKENELCVPCASIRSGPSVEENKVLDEFARKYEENIEMCCVETPSELLLMLELFIEKRYREESAKGNVPRTGELVSIEGQQTAAHLLGSQERLDEDIGPGTRFSVPHWIYDKDIAFLSNMKYRHGRLVVPSDGYYYVYSQVSFVELYSGSNPATQSSSISHYLCRYNIIYPNGGEEILAKNAASKASNSKVVGEYSSHIGALFKLRRDDEVYVKVSDLSLMVRDVRRNYFGIFKLSNITQND
ncbi:uncharacterized protein LOC134243254 [Saccostrea cucullata]|uniref:uncharacterized protein LOC134243254 n=1 Tax=Saccostrea cuccullata TaxID=36930 RepID=UPI002ED28DB8